MQKRIMHLLALLLLLTVAACGTVATPESAVEDTTDTSEVADVPTDAPTDEPTDAPTDEPTATPEPTDAPTDAPTDEPTATPEPTDEPASDDEEDESDETAAETDDFAQLVQDAIDAGDPEAGQAVFVASYETSSGVWMCSTCHSVDESQMRMVGPGLWNLHETAAERIEDSGDADPVEYVRNSIIHSNDYIVPADEGGPYPENLMPANYEDVLTDEELTDLIAYLLTLGNEG